MPHVTKAVTVLGLALVAWGLVVVIGQSSAKEAMLRTIAEQKAENAAIVESAYREKRADSLKYMRMVAEALRSVRVAEGRSRSTLAATERTIDSLRSAFGNVGQDSVPRVAFTHALAQYDSLATAFRAYLMSDSTYHGVIEAERASVYSLLTLADSTIAAKNAALRAWEVAARPLPWYKKVAKSLCVGGVSAGAAGAGAAIGDVQGAAIGALSGVIVGSLSCR